MDYKNNYINESGGSNSLDTFAISTITERLILHLSTPDLSNETIRKNLDFPEKFISKLSDEEDYICGGALIIIGIIAVIGNGGSIYMFWKRLKSITPAEFLLFNLAWANLLLAGCSYPANMVTFLVHRWILGETGCKIYGFIVYLLGIANIMSVAALAVVRYCKTCTVNLSTLIDINKVKIIVAVIYIFSTVWSILPLLGFGDYEVEPFGTSCTLDWANPSRSGQLYIALSVLLIVLIPLFVMFVCYFKILLLVHKNNIKRKKFAKKFGSQTTSSPSELQLTMISFLVALGYLAAWMPYAVVSVYYGMAQKKFPPVYISLIPVLLAKSSCAYNPVIYVFVTARYRKDIYKLIYAACGFRRCCRTTRRNSNDMDSSTTFRKDDLTLSVEIIGKPKMNGKFEEPRGLIAKKSFIADLQTEMLNELDKLKEEKSLESDPTKQRKTVILDLNTFNFSCKNSDKNENSPVLQNCSEQVSWV